MSGFADSLSVIDGVVDAPYCMGIYGKGGVGKSHLAAYTEDPFYVAMEHGTNLIKAKKFNVHPKSVDEVFEMVRWLLKNPDGFKTVVFDSLGFFQSMVYADVMLKNPTTGGSNPQPATSIASYGYHSGYAMALPYFEKLLVGIDALQAKGKNVVLITHSQLKNVTNESGESYKITDFALQSPNNGDVSELLRRRLDVCLYMESTARTVKKKSNYGNATTVPLVGSRPEVTIYTRATSSFFAKVRSQDESKIHDYYSIDPNDLDGSSKAIIDAVTSM